MTLTHRRIYQVACQRMEHYIVLLQLGQLSNRIECPSQIPVCILLARLLPVKTYSTIQNKTQVDFPLFLTANLSTLSKNRRFASIISPNLPAYLGAGRSSAVTWLKLTTVPASMLASGSAVSMQKSCLLSRSSRSGLARVFP
jgi:hypothetical protein